MALGIRRICSNVNRSGFWTSPSRDSSQSSRATGWAMISPWLRSKNTALAVIQDRRYSVGVSALSGTWVMMRICFSMTVLLLERWGLQDLR